MGFEETAGQGAGRRGLGARFFAGVARASGRWAGLIVATWALLAIGLAIGAPSLTEVGVQDQASFLPASAPSQQADALLARLYPDDATRNGAILTFTREGGLQPSDQDHIGAVVAKLTAAPLGTKFTGVQSIATAPELAAMLRAPDGAAEIVIVGFKAVPFTEDGDASVHALRSALGAGPAGLQQHVSGIAGLATDQKEALVSSFDRTAIVTVLLVLAILVAVYRSAVAPLIPLVSIGVAFVVAQGVVGVMAQHGFKVASLAGTFMVVMIFGAGTDYCLFLVSRYREDLTAGEGPGPTLLRTSTTIGPVVAASGATVIVGFLSQGAAKFGMYRTMGPAMGVAIFITMLAGLTLTPALVKLAGRHAFWPTSLERVAATEPEVSDRWHRLGAAIRKRPAVLLLAGVILLQLMAAGLGGYRQSFDLVSGLPKSADSRKGFDAIAKHLPGGTLSPTFVVIDAGRPLSDADLAAVDRLTDRLKSVPDIGEVRSITQPAGQPLTTKTISALGGGSDPRSLGIDPNTTDIGPLLSAMGRPEGLRFTGPLLRQYPALAERLDFFTGTGGHATRLVVTAAGNPYSPEALAMVRGLDDVSTAALSGGPLAGATVRVGGPSAFYVDMNDIGSDDFRLIVAVLLGGIFVVLALLLRSLVAPFYLLATVVASYAATMGLTVAVFQGLLGSPGLPFYLPPFLFVILVALGADYNIFIMSRIREEADAGYEIHEATERGLVLTGPVITSAGFILAGTFGVLVLAPLPDLRQIGFAVTIGVLLDTFVVRTILVPAATILLGRWAFWPAIPGAARAAPQRRHVGFAGAGITAFASLLLVVALSGGVAPAVTTVPAAAARAEVALGATVDAPSPTLPASPGSGATVPVAGKTTSASKAPTASPSTGATGATTPRPSSSTSRPAPPTAGAATASPVAVAVPAEGAWRFRAQGKRKVGVAGSEQPFDEEATTTVKRTSGSGNETDVELATSSSNGEQRDTRRFRPSEVRLVATQVSSNGMGFGGTLTPPPLLLRWPAKAGDAWAGDWKTGDVTGRTTAKVGATRDITTPAGSFRCTDVVLTTTFNGTGTSGTQQQTDCWVPSLGMAVSSDGRYQGTYQGIPFDITTTSTLLQQP